MFSREKHLSQNYLMIMETISNQEPGLYSPKFQTKEAVTLFASHTKKFSINRVLSLSPEKRDTALASIMEFIDANGFATPLLNSLDAIVGSSIQDEQEVNVWLKGLATNAFLFGGKPDEIVELYKKQPVLIALRFMELVTVDKQR